MLPLGCPLPLEYAGILEGDAAHLLDDELGDRHAGAEDEIRRPEVDDLQRQRPLESRVNRGRREVDQYTTAGHATAPLDPGRKAGASLSVDGMIEGEADILSSPAQDELECLEGIS